MVESKIVNSENSLITEVIGATIESSITSKAGVINCEFRECEREIKEAKDNEQKEWSMKIYGGKDDGENNGDRKSNGQGTSTE